MPEERRQSHIDISESLREFKTEIKSDMKEIRDDIKELEGKIHETVTTNNKFYFNGFEPHKHVADHHIIDNIIDKTNADKKSVRNIVEKWIDRLAWAAMTFIAVTTWNSLQQNKEYKPPVEKKIERKAHEAANAEHP